jgi:acyl carrier protein
MNTSLSRAEITERVVSAIKRLCEVEKELTPRTPLLEELDMDSLTMMRLDIALQSDLGLALAPDDIEKVVTLSDLVDALIERGQPVEDVEA